MAPQFKQPISGLRTVKRDFSAATLPPSSQDSAIGDSDASAIPWAPSPPKPARSGLNQRLKDIQDALDGQIISSEKALAASQHPSGPISLQKRPSTAQDPPAKRRQLPDSWNEAPTYTDAGSRGAFGSSRVNGGALVIPASATTNSVSKPAEVLLSAEQKHILKLVEEGNSVFYTGSAGTGKSVLLREIIKSLRRKHRAADAVAITASTGIAACNIGGVTIHSFSGIGLGRESAEVLANKIKKNKKASARWLRTQVLIIDEVSMVEGDLFDKLARIGSLLRKRLEPFGGIQVVVTGDFFQLPPVTKSGAVKFAFEAELWGQAIKKTFNLKKVFRQRDQTFVDMLTEMRLGNLSQASIAKFRSLEREIIYEDGLGATELFPRREDVERSNTMRMNGIDGEMHSYSALDGGLIVDEDQRQKMLNNFMAPGRLVLKIGAQVMLIKNVDEWLVNGSIGRVIRFVDAADPGAHLEELEESKGGKPVSKGAKPVSKNGKEKKAGMSKLHPLVDFLLPDGNRRRMVVMPEVFKIELPSGEVQVSRTQLPLILAWAMSIHKSQGQTLERVKVDLAKVFEKGQAYVALSRATSLDGLQVLHFDPAKVQAHPKVVKWSNTLEIIADK